MKLLARVFNKIGDQNHEKEKGKVAHVKPEENVNLSKPTVEEILSVISSEVARLKETVKTFETIEKPKLRFKKQSRHSWNEIIVEEQHDGMFTLNIIQNKKTIVYEASVSTDELLLALKATELLDVKLKCSKRTFVFLVRNLPKEWFGKQRNISINIQKSDMYVSTVKEEVSFLKAVIAVYHSMAQNGIGIHNQRKSYHYSELMKTHHEIFRLRKLPSGYFGFRKLTVACTGIIIPKTLAMRALLSCNFENGLNATAYPAEWKTMRSILNREADDVKTNNNEKKVVYFLNGKWNTITKL